MPFIYKIATININGISSANRILLLGEFLFQNDIEIALLQEVTTTNLTSIRNYTVFDNIGTDGRGTAILAKPGINLTDVKRLPSGRGIAASFFGTKIVNIYAPSGAEKKADRERFFANEILPLLPSDRSELLLAGDFNCILHTAESTGNGCFSRSLGILVREMELYDAWDNKHGDNGYTHYSLKSASRIDRIYLSRTLLQSKSGIETRVVACTDHLAVVIRMGIDRQLPTMGRGYWKMNASLLQNHAFVAELKSCWSKWQQHKKYYPTITFWWCRYVKRMIRTTCICESKTRLQDQRNLENFYYQTIYSILETKPPLPETMYIKLKELKAKIVRIHNRSQEKLLLNLGEHDRNTDEIPSLYHLLKQRKRQTFKVIHQVRDGMNTIQTTPFAILRVFTTEMKNKYDSIPHMGNSMQQLLRHACQQLPATATTAMEEPLSLEELHHAIKQGKKGKSPGLDGISHEFYQETWDIIKDDMLNIFSHMYMEGGIQASQTHGLIVCLPKHGNPVTTDDYRPLTLLNSDYKIFARILANRIRPWINDILHPCQHCGVGDNNILSALSEVRDTIAHAEYTNAPICLLSLDFKGAFDKISHTYLLETMKAYGFSETMSKRIFTLYNTATSSVQINGHISSPFPIRCSIRQGCPLSMLLFTLCLDPFLRLLDEVLNDTTKRRRKRRTAVIAYADDVTIILTDPNDIPKVQDAICLYTDASGAELNVLKSAALPLGAWNTGHMIFGVPYRDNIKILGINMTRNLNRSARICWTNISNMIRIQARDVYNRDLQINQRIRYVNGFLLAKVWYLAQILPPPLNNIRQINTAIAWFIWRGDIFRVPLSTLYKPKHQGGWGLINVHAKCRALLIFRMQTRVKKPGSITERLLNIWNLTTSRPNPPNRSTIPRALVHLLILELDSAYITSQQHDESDKVYKKRLYYTQLTMLQAEIPCAKMRIERIWTGTHWDAVWKNLWATPVPEYIKACWYKALHDIVPTNARLYAIHISSTDRCSQCLGIDTIQHRITGCVEGAQQWTWTKRCIAYMLRTVPSRIPDDWLLRPDFTLWPSKRHRAVLWLLAHYVCFRTRQDGGLTILDYFDFLRRCRWKLYRGKKRFEQVGNYLCTMDM